MYNYFGSLHAILWLMQAFFIRQVAQGKRFRFQKLFPCTKRTQHCGHSHLSNGHKKSAHGPRVITVFALFKSNVIFLHYFFRLDTTNIVME